VKFWTEADKLRDKLNLHARGELYSNYSLMPISWFRVGGCAEILFVPKDEEDLKYFLSRKPEDIPITIIGGASNLLIRDYGIPGIVIILGKAFNYINLIEDKRINIGASVPNKKISNFALKNNLQGFSFLNTIPGTLGGSIKMNAGAYGSEIKDILYSIKFIDTSGTIKKKSISDIKYEYRTTDISDKMICVSSILEGGFAGKDDIKQEIEKFKLLRNTTQPIKERTGGSTFKNTENKKAWELIRDAECDKLVIGGAMISQRHSNFIINKGNASAYDIELLGETIIERVKKKTGIKLEWEIKRMGLGPEVTL
jgi:UDP-N-acetylmuramate dehydrogenase